MGTTLHIAVAAPSRANGIEAIEDAFAAVRHLDSLLSTWQDGSEISRLNHATPREPVLLSAELFVLLQEAARWTRLTGGGFDPGIGSLVDAWDLRGKGRVPPPSVRARALEASGIDRFVFDATHRTGSRASQSAWIDTGGFGKGAALRAARRALQRGGISSGILNFGGQVVVLGTSRYGGDWDVPVAHPSRRDEPAAWLHLRDRSASTSSQSERFVTADGRRLGHIVDPRTGEPVSPWGSVTVVSEDPTTADVLSTALLVLGPEAGLEWARPRRDVGVLFLIERDGGLERRWNHALEEFTGPQATNDCRLNFLRGD
jgi:thiamine biosynthesis lipoprotein